MFECFHCMQRAAIWDADFNADEYGYDDPDGVIHELHCCNCGARITVYVAGIDEEGDEGDDHSAFETDIERK